MQRTARRGILNSTPFSYVMGTKTRQFVDHPCLVAKCVCVCCLCLGNPSQTQTERLDSHIGTLFEKQCGELALFSLL